MAAAIQQSLGLFLSLGKLLLPSVILPTNGTVREAQRLTKTTWELAHFQYMDEEQLVHAVKACCSEQEHAGLQELVCTCLHQMIIVNITGREVEGILS